MKTIKELELSLIVKEAMIQQLKLKNNQLEEKINKAIDKAKTMKASMLIDTIDGIEIDSKFVHDLYALIEYMENELKGVDKDD